MISASIRRLRCAWALLALLFCAPALAQSDEAVAARTYDLPPTVPGEYHGDLRHLPPVYVPRRYLMLNEFEAPAHHKPVVSPTQEQQQQVAAPNAALAAMPAPSANFPGLGFNTVVSGGTAGGGWPPDVNGDVGPTVYIQSVNSAFGIFSKANGATLASFTEDQLWGASGLPTSNPCNGNNDGDPVVLHDALHDRWILTDFAFALSGGNPVAPFYECIAVSKTGDPLSGGWWFYSIRMDTGSVPSNTLPDYPKFGVWNDGCLYMGANGFDIASGNYAGPIFASFNTVNLYAGTTLTSSVGFLANNSIFSMFPANLLGTSAGSMPPAGRQEFFVAESSSGFSFDVRKFTKGANCGAGGTLGAATAVSQSSYGYPAIKAMGKYTPEMVQQSGTTNRLDSLGDRIMQKVQYRKIGINESLWVVHATCGVAQNVDGACANNSSAAQPQWAQISVTGGTIGVTPVQQQIYAPDSTLSRWMAGLAVDGSGDMAMGYSTSGASAFPSIRYAGRLVGDSKNTLPQSEVQLVAGAAAQTNKIGGEFISRWGDYSSMSIDPTDDCTFWYTNEYYDTQTHGTNGTWQTRIGAFKFPSCTSSTPTHLAFTQQPNSSYASAATITMKVSVEDAGGSVVPSASAPVTLALQGGTAGALLSGTTTVTPVAGVATFSVAVDRVGSGYKLHATSGSLTAADSTAFAITPGAAAKLAFQTQPPASVQAGSQFGLAVKVEDAAGNTVSSGSSAITLALTCACASVSNNTVVTIAGVATFSGLAVTKAGNNYQLHATDSNAGIAAADSNAFNVTAAATASITFTTQPPANSSVTAGAVIPIAAHVKDAYGNPVINDNVTLALANNPGGSTLSAAINPLPSDSSGNVVYTNVALNKAANGYRFKVTEAGNAHGATGNAFNIAAGAPASITLTTQPATNANITAVAPISIVAHVQDNNGNAIVGDAVTLAIANNAGGATLSAATNPVATNSSGNAAFTASLDKIGTGYTLQAGENLGALAVTSHAFNIVLGPPTQLLFTTQPSDVTSGNTLNTIAISEADAGGNLITGDSTTSVDFTFSACGGTALGSATMSNGVATLASAQVFTTLRAGLHVSANDASLSIVGFSQAFVVGPGDLLFANSYEDCTL